LINNATGLHISDANVESNSSTFFGTFSLDGPPANTGIVITGASSNVIISGGVIGVCVTGLNITNNALCTVSGVSFRINTFDIVQNSASQTTLSACTFELTTGSSDIDLQVSGAGTLTNIISCEFNGNSLLLGSPEAAAILVSDNASVTFTGGIIHSYTTGIQVGLSSDTSSTMLSASGLVINNCTTDIMQEGSSSLNFNEGTAASSKISINDPTNVTLAFFNLDADNALTIGSLTNENTRLLQAGITPTNNPQLDYLSSLYSTQAIGLHNPLLNPTSWFVISQDNANLTAITTNRTDSTNVRLVSDTGSPVGGTSALRGWDIKKNGSSAQLSFTYQNSDIVGQSVISPYVVMQLDGVNNQLQLPTVGTQIVFDGDTNLYRSSANVLKTDDNFIVGTLTPGRVVITDPVTNQLESSVTTSTELSYVSGVTSPIQTQLNGKVNKSGDTMTGTLSATDIIANNISVTGFSATDSVIQNETITHLSVTDEIVKNFINFQDIAGAAHVGLQSPAVVPASYTLSLPSTIPTSHQIMRANAITPTNLEWATEGGSVVPAASETIYVAKYGSDITGDGSFNNPYASLFKAISVANGLASALNPVAIVISAGIYVEDNSAGPLTITADGISITGVSATTVIIVPNTPANDLISSGHTVVIESITCQSPTPLATAINLTAGIFSAINNVQIFNFLTGVNCTGASSSYGINTCVFVSNGTAVNINDVSIGLTNSTIIGASSISGPAANTGVSVTGASAQLATDTGVMLLCDTGFNITGNAAVTLSDIIFKINTFDIIQTGASHLTLSACTFEFTTGSSDIDVQVSGAGTLTNIISCEFNGNSLLGAPEATAILVSDNASVTFAGGIIHNYTTGMHIGVPADTSSTMLSASGLVVNNCTTDIIQEGSSSLNFNAGTATSSKISISDPTNVTLAFFNLGTNNALTIGSTANQNTTLLQADINPTNNPQLDYLSSLYSTQAIGLHNPLINPTSWFVVSQANANLTAVTTNRTDSAGVRLVSDTGSPVGGTSALRGWDISKNGSSAQLSFTYQNSDIVGQSVISPYVVMQLDGVNNQLQLPTAGTQIVFDGDTNLYRSSANVLKTDDNFIVGTLTPDRVVITDAITNQLESSVTTSTELGYVSGVTSPIQTQLNGKVSKSGDTMTGTLTLPAGSVAVPSLQFTGSTNTGLSAATVNTLSFDTNGVERLKIDGLGNISIDNFTIAGVVHNDATGLLSSSLIVNADITNATISNAKLATISSGNTPGDIVVRDGSGNFTTNMITILGTVTNNTDVATKAYVDSAVSTGLVVHTPAVAVSLTNQTLSGFPTIDGVTFPEGTDRVLLTGQTNPVENGLWVVAAGPWSRPTDFATGTAAGEAYVLILEGSTQAGSSWLCSTPTAIIDTDPIHFELFSLPNQTTGANVGAGTGLIFRDKTGTTLNFKSLIQGSHIVITNNANDITLATDGTSANTASTLVARDASGNFSAGTITASLTGHASLDLPLTGGTLTGTLTVPAGSAGSPSLQFTGSTNTGLSAATANTLSFDTNGVERLKIDGSGNISIDGFSTAGVVHNDATGLLSSSLIVNADVDPAAGIVDTKLATISTAGKVANSATTATSLNNPNTIVLRDAFGNFNAGTIVASLSGAASLNVLKAGDTMTGTLQLPAGTTASPSLVFTGSTTTGFSASAGSLSFNTSALERMKISSGGVISIDAFTVPGVVHNDASGNLSSSLIVNADVDPAAAIVDTKLATISTAGKVANSATTATSTNTANAIVARDASGNFSAGTITANLNGNATTATTATNFSGSLSGDVTGTQSATVVSFVGGQSAANVAAATVLANNATSANTANQIVKRSASGGFSAGAISVTDAVISNTATITPFSTAGVVHNDATGLLSSSLIVNADVDPAAGIVDTKLATISTAGKVANSATTATNLNNSNTIVLRDAFGNFNAGTIVASLSGAASLNVLKAGDTMTGTLQLPAGTTAAPSLVFTGSTTTGLSASAGSLSFNTSALERMKISSGGTISIDAFTVPGVVHNDASGNLSSSLIVNADVDPAAGIVDTKLATISTAGKVANSATTATSADVASTIVSRDASGNFATHMITIDGTTTNPTDVATKAYVDSATSAITGANVGVGTGLIFRDKTGNTLNFKSLIQGSHVVITNNANDITLATDATNLNTVNTIVARDASGNFSAGIITASLNGNATTATTATNFSGSLSGDVTGTQSATVVSFVGGQSAANVAAATVLANNATSANTANQIVKRSATGGFSAGAISVTDEVISSTATILPFSTAGVVHNNSSGLLSSSLIVDADITAATITNDKLANISSSNIANDIVVRDGSGNFSAGTITANLNGNATTATTATNFSGSLSGDVTGTQSATVVSFVGGQSAANVAAATVLANNATSANTANQIVKRSATGGFSAGAISVTDEVISNSVTIIPFSTAGVVHNSASGLLSSSLIVDADITAATITNDKLANISSSNIANDIVVRDASGNFSAGTITANLNGNATTATNFSGSLSGDVTGTQSATVVSFVGGQSAANVAAGTVLANNATSANTANQIVKRDASGNFSTNMITIAGTTTNPTDVATKAYVDSTVGGTSLNTPNTVVKRDGTGSFAAQEISMNDGIISSNLILSTNPSTSTAGNILKGASRFIHNTGTNNTFVGITAGNFTTTGTGQNSAFGVNTLTANTTGANNTAIGYNALSACTIGSGNIAIGSGTAVATTTGSNNIYIGTNDGPSGETLTIRIGSQITNQPTACYIQGIVNGVSIPPGHNHTVLIDDRTGLLSITTSSRRFKHNIEDMDDASANIYQLRPVNFAYNDDATESKHYGLIAEEVDQILPEIVTRDKNGVPFSVRYDVLPILLVKEIQKQHNVIENLTITVDQMSMAIADLQAQIKQFIEQSNVVENHA
jgi:gas vesicle protein